MSLNRTIHEMTERLTRELTERFTSELLAAMKGASLDDLVTLTQGGGGHARRGPGRPLKSNHATTESAVKKRRSKRLHRRSATDLTKMVEEIVAVVKANRKGIRAEGIKAALKIDRRELPRPLGLALKTRKIRKRGRRRSTTYYAA